MSTFGTTSGLVVVTGGSGLLGLHFVAYLLQAGYKVRATYQANKPKYTTSADFALLVPHINVGRVLSADDLTWQHLDIQSPESVALAIQDADVVVHAAAVVSFSRADRNLMYRTNVEGTRLLVDTLLAIRPTARLIYISSVAALGKPQPSGIHAGLIDADSQWDDNTPHTYYGATKFMGELEVWRGIQEGLTGLVLNPALVLAFGNWHQSSAALFKYVQDQKPFYTEGTLNYIDAEDLARYVVWAASTSQHLNKRYVASAGTVPYKSFFDQVAQVWGIKPPSIQLSEWVGNIAWRLEAIRRMLFGGKAFITRETVATAFRSSTYVGDVLPTVSGLPYTKLDVSISRIAKLYSPD